MLTPRSAAKTSKSEMPGTGKLRFIEVKGHVKESTTVIVTKNEVLTALNKPDDFFLAIVMVDGETTTLYYIPRPFQRKLHSTLLALFITWTSYSIKEPSLYDYLACCHS